jgi:hypothetical protein
MLEKIYIPAQIISSRLRETLESLEIINNQNLFFMSYVNKGPEIAPVSATNSAFITFFPILSKTLGVEIVLLMNIFFHLIYFLSLIFSIYFISKLYGKNSLKKILSSLFTMIIYFYLYNRLFGLAVEYVTYFIAVMLFVPFGICIYLKKLNYIKINILLTIFFFIGFILNLIKDYSSLAALIFVIIIIFYVNEKKSKLISLFFLTIYILAPISIDYYIKKKQQDNYFALYSKKYEYNHILSAPLWISAYSGLGFISEKGLNFSDESAQNFINKKRNSEITFIATEENSLLLKEEFFRIITSDIGYTVRLYSAKFGVLLFYIIAIMNFSILYFFSKEFDKKLRVLFVGLMFFYSIFPMITVPGLGYITGVIATSLTIFIYSLTLFSLRDFIKKIKFFF